MQQIGGYMTARDRWRRRGRNMAAETRPSALVWRRAPRFNARLHNCTLVSNFAYKYLELSRAQGEEFLKWLVFRVFFSMLQF